VENYIKIKEESFIMKINAQQVEKLLKGNQTFSQFGFSMLVTRLKTAYTKNPTPVTVQDCMAQINAFLEKFKSIMSADYALITKL